MYIDNFQSQPGNNECHPTGMQFHCANCDIDFTWSPVVQEDNTYCCRGCAAGGPCSCDYSQYSSVNIFGVIHYGFDESEEHSSKDSERQ